MKRLFGIVLVAGLVAVGAVAWAQDDPASQVRAAVSSPVEVAPAPEVAVAPAPEVAPEPVVESAAPEVVGPQQPAGEVPIAWPVPEAPPAPPEGRTVCEIVHSGNSWGVYGTTTLARGTVFTLTVETDGTTHSVDLTARAGGIVIAGVRYGAADGYTDDGTTVFGPTTDQMIHLEDGHGPVVARVTQGGITHCATTG